MIFLVVSLAIVLLDLDRLATTLPAGLISSSSNALAALRVDVSTRAIPALFLVMMTWTTTLIPWRRARPLAEVRRSLERVVLLSLCRLFLLLDVAYWLACVRLGSHLGSLVGLSKTGF